MIIDMKSRGLLQLLSTKLIQPFTPEINKNLKIGLLYRIQ